MPGRSKHPALDALSTVERGGLLDALLRVHPELVGEAEAMAVARLAQVDCDAVAADLAGELRALRLEELASRAGRQWGGGYVDPHEAAHDLLAEAVRPYLDDLGRRAAVGAKAAAEQIARGVLAGLYACRDEDDNDLVLTHAGMPDAVDDLVHTVLRACDKAGIAVSEQGVADHCPAWTDRSSRH
jgi:hypothetical protein